MACLIIIQSSTAGTAIATLLLLVALICCAQLGSGDEIVFRNEMGEGRMLYITCIGNGGQHRQIRELPVAYHANITFTMPSYILDMVLPHCVASYADQPGVGGHPLHVTFTAYSFPRDHRRCKERCVIAAMPDALFSMEFVGYYGGGHGLLS